MRTAKEVLAGGRMKGGVFKSHLAWLAENRPPEDKKKLADALTPETQKIVNSVILAAHWYPFASLVEVDRTLMNLFGEGKREFLHALGRYSAKVNLSGTYRAFDRGTNHEFFRNSALLHSQFQDFGKAIYEQTGPSSGKMVHSDYVCYSRTFCDSAIGYYDGCITSHGGTHATVRETQCQCYGEPTCTYEMTWT